MTSSLDYIYVYIRQFRLAVGTGRQSSNRVETGSMDPAASAGRKIYGKLKRGVKEKRTSSLKLWMAENWPAVVNLANFSDKRLGFFNEPKRQFA
jgi:post-segregation antitoxin (ccd killing protein)